MNRYFHRLTCIVFAACLAMPMGGGAQTQDEKVVELPGLSSNSVPLVFVKIPAGSFMMGSPESEQGHEFNESPQHEVVITEPFYMGKYEVTQAQWNTVMDYNPSVFTGDELPVNKVTWIESQTFILKLRHLLNDQGFRLPTEAEHEYASRAGTTGQTFFGEDPSAEEMQEYVWYRENSDYEMHPVGMLKPNPWGLYDILGNAWEWCSDWFYLYSEGIKYDPQGPAYGHEKVIRGPSWMGRPEWVRCADRGKFPPDEAYHTGGFRLVWQPAE